MSKKLQKLENFPHLIYLKGSDIVYKSEEYLKELEDEFEKYDSLITIYINDAEEYTDFATDYNNVIIDAREVMLYDIENKNLMVMNLETFYLTFGNV